MSKDCFGTTKVIPVDSAFMLDCRFCEDSGECLKRCRETHSATYVMTTFFSVEKPKPSRYGKLGMK